MNIKNLLKKIIYKTFGVKHPRLFLHQLSHKISLFLQRPFLRSSYLFSDLEDAYIHVQISNRCNCKYKFCGWQTFSMHINMEDYIKGGMVDWDCLFNAPEIRLVRKQMLEGDYRTCMKCCPVIPSAKKNK